MDELVLLINNVEINSIESLVAKMKKERAHWILWPGDEAPCFIGVDMPCPYGEVIFELYWKNGWASDIHKIRCRTEHWWKSTNHSYVKVEGKIIGEVLCLYG
jgi:hypothetical protein